MENWVRGKPIGRGSFGCVNLAFRNGCLMAVKSCGVSDSASLRNEFEILSQLGGDCSSVISCFGGEFSLENNNLFLEYACGGSLGDELKNCDLGSFSESRVREYTESILHGLNYIHKNGFVHCDIKLDNLLLCGNKVKIGDFGLAKRVDEKKRGFELRGTPLCMSPEVVNGSDFETASDIWALGCVVVEMLTGSPAWRVPPETDVGALFLRIGLGEESPEIPGELSEEGKDFLEKCFLKDPMKRWTAEMLLTHPFIVNENDRDGVTVPFVSASPESAFEFSECIRDTVSLISTSPRSAFNFPDWDCSMSSPATSPESEFWFDVESESESAVERIRRLGNDQMPDWSVSDSWVTVR